MTDFLKAKWDFIGYSIIKFIEGFRHSLTSHLHHSLSTIISSSFKNVNHFIN